MCWNYFIDSSIISLINRWNSVQKTTLVNAVFKSALYFAPFSKIDFVLQAGKTLFSF